MRYIPPPVPPDRCEICGAALAFRNDDRCPVCRRLDYAYVLLERLMDQCLKALRKERTP